MFLLIMHGIIQAFPDIDFNTSHVSINRNLNVTVTVYLVIKISIHLMFLLID